MDCVMGAALLRARVIEFDYAAARVQLHAASKFAAPPDATTVPLIFRSNPSVPFVGVHIDLPDGSSRDLQTLVDTGCTYFALALAPPASTWVQQRAPTAAFPDAETAGGSLHLLASRPRRISVGALNVAEPVVALIASGMRGVDDGLLGVGFLHRFTMWIDFDRKMMYLLPNRNLEVRQLFDASGLGFKRVDDGYEVDVVLPDTSELGFAALTERLSHAGRCELTLQRGQSRVVKNLILAARL